MQTQDTKGNLQNPASASTVSDTRVKTADHYTVRELLRIRMGIGQVQNCDEPGEYYWAELLKGCAEADVMEAAWAHYRHKSRPLWPADVLDWVRHEARRRRQRTHDARERAITSLTDFVDDPSALMKWTRVLDEEINRGAMFMDAVAAAECAVVEANLSRQITEVLGDRCDRDWLLDETR